MASMLICEMAAYHKAQGKTLLTRLEELYQQHGYYQEALDFAKATQFIDTPLLLAAAPRSASLLPPYCFPSANNKTLSLLLCCLLALCLAGCSADKSADKSTVCGVLQTHISIHWLSAVHPAPADNPSPQRQPVRPTQQAAVC